jgi:hypothetical protein
MGLPRVHATDSRLSGFDLEADLRRLRRRRRSLSETILPSRDGAQIAFAASDGTHAQIWTANADGTRQRPSHPPTESRYPAWQHVVANANLPVANARGRPGVLVLRRCGAPDGTPPPTRTQLGNDDIRSTSGGRTSGRRLPRQWLRLDVTLPLGANSSRSGDQQRSGGHDSVLVTTSTPLRRSPFRSAPTSSGPRTTSSAVSMPMSPLPTSAAPWRSCSSR